MKNILAVTAAAVVISAGVLASGAVHAQTKPIQAPPPPAREMDPAKRIPPPPAPDAPDAPVAGQATPGAQAPVAPQHGQPASASHAQYTAVPSWQDTERGGFFLGIQGGRGWVYDDVDQTALAISAGYRWQAGAVSLLGIEVAAGRLDATTDDGWEYSKVEYASIGFNGRFNFGATSPVYALVRTGYFSADEEHAGSADGGYFGVGLGMDFSRNFNMSLVYTNYVYFNELYWYEGDLYYDAGRADTLMLGAEARF